MIYYIDSIKNNYGPREEVVKRLPEVETLIKMREQDSAFICGLLEQYRPKKILEVGIGHGGTSAIIMECMHELGLSCELHCVDRKESGYDGSDREIGFLGKEACKLFGFDRYHLWKGAVLPQVIDQIGFGIDFMILDTNHKLPGEAMDFLAAYPYLSQNAVVCLHDIRQNQKTPPKQEQIATNVLFNSVAADKFINTDPERQPDYANIGAFRINSDTEKYITNVFGALTLNWSYFPLEDELNAYSEIIRRHYSEEACWIFDRAVWMNKSSLSEEI